MIPMFLGFTWSGPLTALTIICLTVFGCFALYFVSKKY